MTDDVIEVQKVWKTYDLNYSEKSTVFESTINAVKQKKSGKFNALTNVSFSIKRGEMVGIIGHNGSGKSTLLKLLCGISTPTSGTVNSIGKITSFLQLGSGFHPDLTVVENIKIYGILLGIKKSELVKKIPKILEFAELERFQNAKTKKLSSGMFARLAFSTAIQADPDILIIDEVLSVGDLAFQQKSRDAFLEFKKKGKTIIYVTHNLQDVLDLCDRVILLYKGHIADIGNPSGVVDKYRTVVEHSPDFNEEEITKMINKHYQQILGRDGDVIGVLEYIYKIKKQELQVKDIPDILRNSEEFRMKNS